MTRHGPRLRYPGGWRALWGAVAFAAAYAVVYLAAGRRFDAVASRAAVPGGEGLDVASAFAAVGVDPAAWRAAGWLFFNAHLVGLTVPQGPNRIARTNVLLGAGGVEVFLLAVPPLLLVVAGALVTVDRPSATDLRFDLGVGPGRYALNGAVVPLLTYLPLVVLAAGGVSVGGYGVDGIGALAVAGFGYPLAFGGVGGLVGRRIANRRADETDADRSDAWGADADGDDAEGSAAGGDEDRTASDRW